MHVNPGRTTVVILEVVVAGLHQQVTMSRRQTFKKHYEGAKRPLV